MTQPARETSHDPTAKVAEAAARYAAGEDRPLAGYGVVEAAYVAVIVVIGLLARRTGRPVPELRLRDVALVGVATHRIARTLTKDAITSPLRMPFTRYEGPGGPAELHEKVVVGHPVGHAVGELVTCPFCMGHWVATGFAAGMIFAPRVTRLTAATFASVALADFLQFAYAKVGD